MVNELASIERLYGRLLGEKLIPSLALRLSQENQVLATHHSTSIEGNPLSPQDVTNIHPFFDGNGRLARILTTYYLLLNNYEVGKLFILDDFYDVDRQLYSDTLHLADAGDKTKWLEYFLEGIAVSLQGAIARISDLKRTNLEEIKGGKRAIVSSQEEKVLQIVLDKKAIKTSDIQNALSVTRQQVHSLLHSLVKKGLLEKFGKTKTSYYKLAKETQV